MNDGVELKDIRVCDVCHGKIAGVVRDGMNALDFHVICIDRHMLHMRDLQSHVGLTMMLGGHEGLAMAMGAARRASILMQTMEIFICNPCWYDHMSWVYRGDEMRGKEILSPEDAVKREGL